MNAAKAQSAPEAHSKIGHNRLQRFDTRVQAAFMSRGLVGADQALAGGFVDHGNAGFVQFSGLILVAGVDSGYHFFDIGTKLGALSRIVGTTFVSLSGAFSSLC